MHKSDENRAMLLTPPGTAAIAVVRLVGPAIEQWLSRFFSPPVPPGRCVHGELRDLAGKVIDDPIVVRCGPAAVDVNLHGGTWIVHATLQAARESGFAVDDALPIPLLAGAVDAGNVIDTEVMQYLPLARTELALRVLLAQPKAWERLRHDITAGRLSRDDLQRIAAHRGLHWLLSLPRVAIVGPANVGKSTLANELFGQTRSITADMPGTTRDWVGEVANVDGLAVMLLDTPGDRDSTETPADPIETAALAASAAPIRTAELVVVVLDGSVPVPRSGRALLDRHAAGICVANKSDRPAAWDRRPLAAIETVATQGADGVSALRKAILKRFQCDSLSLDEARWWTPRQQRLLETTSLANGAG